MFSLDALNIDAIYEKLEVLAYENSNPFVACVVSLSSGEILEYGFDHHWISPILHCETQAIHKLAKKRFEKSDCRFSNFQDIAVVSTAEPCPMCQAAIMWAGINQVFYGCSRDFLVQKKMDFFKIGAK